MPDYIRADGSTCETLRDLWHTQMGLAPLVAVAEMAWRQGIDCYSAHNNRLLKAVELHSTWSYGDPSDWPYQQEARAAGKVWPFYELVRYHYNHRMSLPLPRVMHVLAATRPEGYDRMGYWGLTHGGQ